MEKQFIRKRNRLECYSYSCINYYYITICTNEKICIFGEIENEIMHLSRTGMQVDNAIKNIEKIYCDIKVNKYVIMPNHIHMILANDSEKNNMSNVIKQLKIFVSKKCGKFIWGKSFYDHVIRNEQDYLRIWEYIDNNILKWESDEYYMQNGD